MLTETVREIQRLLDRTTSEEHQRLAWMISEAEYEQLKDEIGALSWPTADAPDASGLVRLLGVPILRRVRVYG